MSIIKVVGKKIVEKGLEAVKEGASEVIKIASPDKIASQVTGQGKNEFADYLKNLDPKLSAEQKEKIQQTDAQKLEQTRKMLRAALPPHMRLPPKQSEPRPYEAAIAEGERKKAMAVEAQKMQQAQATSAPSGKQPRGMLGAKRRPKSADFEAKVNIKAG